MHSETTSRSAKAGRNVEFESYVAATQAKHLRTAFLLTGDPHSAEDLVQSALAKLYLSWNRVKDDGSLDAYVRRILVNEHTSWWRRAWRRNETAMEMVPEPRERQPDRYNDVGKRDAMWSTVMLLPPRQRAAIVLRFYEDLSERQTADVLGCSVGAVKSQTSRAVAALRKIWQEGDQ